MSYKRKHRPSLNNQQKKAEDLARGFAKTASIIVCILTLLAIMLKVVFL